MKNWQTYLFTMITMGLTFRCFTKILIGDNIEIITWGLISITHSIFLLKIYKPEITTKWTKKISYIFDILAILMFIFCILHIETTILSILFSIFNIKYNFIRHILDEQGFIKLLTIVAIFKIISMTYKPTPEKKATE